MPLKDIRLIRRDVPPHWVGDGFPVRSLFSYNRERRKSIRFCCWTTPAPYEFAPSDERRGVGEHPHRGFETVTIVYQGELEHRDSAGNHGTIGPGDVQWMTAASGVVHEEFHSDAFTRRGGTLKWSSCGSTCRPKSKNQNRAYQEILAQPDPHRPPRARHRRASSPATTSSPTGPAQTFTPVNLWDLKLEQGETRLPLPDGDTAMLVVRRGTVTTQRPRLASTPSASRSSNAPATRSCSNAPPTPKPSLMAGQPIGEPIVGQGPFVMNTQEEIRQAFIDFQRVRWARYRNDRWAPCPRLGVGMLK